MGFLEKKQLKISLFVCFCFFCTVPDFYVRKLQKPKIKTGPDKKFCKKGVNQSVNKNSARVLAELPTKIIMTKYSAINKPFT